MTTENKTYAVIRTDDYYGPTITHTMIVVEYYLCKPLEGDD